MRRISKLILVLLALSPAGCPEQVYEELTAKYPADGDTSGSATLTSGSATETPTPTTTNPAPADPGVQTVTGASEGTAETTVSDPGTTTASDPSTGPQENAPPTIDLFTVLASPPNPPHHLGEAGQAELQLVVSADVVKVRLTLDDEKLADLTPADFPRTWDALSAKDNGPVRTFKVVVEDAEGLTAEAEDKLSVLLPAPGVEKCIFTDPDAGSLISIVSAVKYTPTAIIAVGTRETDLGLMMTAWMLDPNDCSLVPGWPKSVTNWSIHDDYKKAASIGVAVDLDEDGNIVVAGNFWVGNQPQGYVVLLNWAGARLWEKAGQPGDEITSVAAATAQFKNRVFVGGSIRTSENPVRTDGAIWVYTADDESVFVSPPDILAAPFTPDEQPDAFNTRSEWVRAIVILPGTGNALAVGEREYKADPDNIYSRAFTVQVHPLAGVMGMPWTSWAPSFLHDSVRSIAVCGDDVVAGGWTRDEVPGAKPQPIMFWIEADGTSVKHRHEPQLGSTQINGLACDREAKIVSAATRDSGSRDAQVFAVPGQDGPRTSYETGTPANDGAEAEACDWRGFCAWVGYRTINGKPYAVVRVHHP
jgi:hypothetical protein